MTEREVEALGADGWFVREGFAGAAGAATSVRTTTVDWQGAGVSRSGHRDAAIRGDVHAWVSPGDEAFSALLAAFEALRLEVNAACWLGLVRFELQLACFDGGGAAYTRHRDAFAGGPGRRLTAICYLNPSWSSADGGALRLWVTPQVDLSPLQGRLVVFRSEHVEHEVLPVFATRYAATAWYYGPSSGA